MKCQFTGLCCSGFLKKYWAERWDGTFTQVILCEGCYHTAKTADSSLLFEHLPAKSWIQDLYRRTVGEKNEKQ